jgi:hypothetical protein
VVYMKALLSTTGVQIGGLYEGLSVCYRNTVWWSKFRRLCLLQEYRLVVYMKALLSARDARSGGLNSGASVYYRSTDWWSI